MRYLMGQFLASVLPLLGICGLFSWWPRTAPIIVLLTLLLVWGWTRTAWRWHWRLAWYVRSFPKISRDGIDLYYPPQFEDEGRLHEILQWTALERDQLGARFGTKLQWGKIGVFLFWGLPEMQSVFGYASVGRALLPANAVVITNSNRTRETLRHVLVHLYEARWNPFAPPLLAAGLARWLEGDGDALAIDASARSALAAPIALRGLLRYATFLAPGQARGCFAMAASFTGYLIGRYGWEAYGKLYRRTKPMGFERTFRRCLGTSFEDAERDWRRGLSAAAAV